MSDIPSNADVDTRPPGSGLEPPKSKLSRRSALVWLLLICAGFMLIGILGLNERMLYSPDCSRYVLWAKSLAAFEGFTNASGPEPVRYVVHAPFYPIILAPLAWFFSDIVIPAKVLTLLLGSGLLVLFYCWTSRYVGRLGAVIGTFFLALNPLTILFSDHILSDIPFVACTVIFFMLAERMAEEPENERWGWWLVAALTIGIFLREVGLTLLIGALSYLLVTKQYRRLLLVFTIPMLFYLLWYFRNEVYYAGLENPSIRNMQLFTGHYFTSDSQSFVKELLVRLQSNVPIYFQRAKGLILFPQFLSESFQVVSIADSALDVLMKVLQVVQYPLMVLQYLAFGWGLIARWSNKTTLLILLVSFFYILLVLLYPVNDVRFLLPVMVVVLHFCVLGVRDMARRISPLLRRPRPVVLLAGAFAILLAVPNTVWISGFVRGNAGYLRDRHDPTREVAQWIAQHSDPSTTVFSRWGELAIWLDGRKLVITDYLLSLTLFDSFIRDYNIGYLVSFVAEPGLRDFEFQMLQTKRYALTPVFRDARLEVIQVRKIAAGERRIVAPGLHEGPPGLTSPKELEARAKFATGVYELESGRTAEAFPLFHELLNSSGSEYVGLFCGIALEIGAQYDAALRLYEQLRNQLQAGPYILHTRLHVNLVRDLARAEKESSPEARAEIYHSVSSAFWDLGFRRFAGQALARSLHEDSTFTPSLVFGIYYALQRGDTAVAKRYLGRLISVNPNHMIIRSVVRQFDMMDSIRAARTVQQRVRFQLEIAKGQAQLGLIDGAIDESLSILEQDSVNTGALQLLAEGYDLKDRVAPAVQLLERLVKLKPDDAIAREKLERLKKRM